MTDQPTTPRNPDYEQVVRDNFAGQVLLGHLGAELARVTPGEVDVTLARRPEVLQQNGFFHAGTITAVADAAAGCAALSLMPPGSDVLSVEFKVNLLAPAVGPRLLARGRVVRSGRTITVCRADVLTVAEDGTEKLCAMLTGTMIRAGD